MMRFCDFCVWLTCCKQGRVVRKQVDANPKLKINRTINLSCIQMFFTAFVLCILRLFKLKKQKAKQYTEILIAKLQNSNPNFSYPGLV